MTSTRSPTDQCDVFLSHSHLDAETVEDIAQRLEDEHGIHPWLDQWVLIPGTPFQPKLARGLAEATTCAVCLGSQTPSGWFEMEIQKAIQRQAEDADFRVIAVLLQGADSEVVYALKTSFLELNTWVDFREGADGERALHLLACGVKGVAPGRWTPPRPTDDGYIKQLEELRQLRRAKLIDDDLAIEFQREIVRKRLGF